MALQSAQMQTMNTFLGDSYAIPNYQREYSWEESELEDFWEDLRATVNDLEKETHFFGQVVVHNDESSRKKYIIDGQQRTITSTVFMRSLQVFYDSIYKQTDLSRADYKKSDIASIHLGRYEGPTKDGLHLHLGELDNDYFRSAILLGHPEHIVKQKRRAHERLRKAYQFFYNRIRELIEGENDIENQLDILDAYYETFTKRFKILYMEATKLEEAFVIFETLNARGKDLETADLLKNFIFSQSRDTAGAQRKWNSMVSTLDRADPTKYIRHLWNANNSFTREKNLYKEISKKIKTPRASNLFLEQLEQCAACYHDVSVSNQSDNICFSAPGLLKSIGALKTLKATTFYPIVLAMYQIDLFTENDIEKVVECIETYAFRNFTICGRVANKAELFFADVAEDIFNGILDSVPGIVERIRSEMAGDTEFYDMFSIWSGSKSTKETVRYILRKINKHIDATNEINLENTQVHIEHIMPESNDMWNMPSEIHEAYLWRLGNLTLLSGPINIALSNKPFDEKRGEYVRSKIELNKAILQQDIWTEREIEARQKQLAAYALEIWKK